MRWLAFLILVGFSLVAQTVVAPRVDLLGARCDWLLVVVVFMALHVPTFDAAVGGWVIGAFADLSTIERPGVMAISYMGAALLVAAVREYLFRDSLTTRVVVTGLVCVLVRLVLIVYAQATCGAHSSFSGDFVRHVLLDSVYTAVWAAPIHAVLAAMSRPLGIGKPRYAYAGLSRR